MTKSELAAMIVGITEIAKNLGLPSKYCSLFSVILGVTISLIEAVVENSDNYYGAAVNGLLVGLTTTGSYAAVDKMMNKKNS